MSIQDDLLDLEAFIKDQDADIRDIWERIYTWAFLNDQKRIELEKDLGTIKAAVYIIKKHIGSNTLKRISEAVKEGE